MRAAAARFVRRIGHRPIAVGTLTRPADLVATPDDDRTQLTADIDRIETNPEAAAVPLAAVANAVRTITADGAPFSTVIVLSARPIESETAAAAGVVTTIVSGRTVIHAVALQPQRVDDASTAADVLRDLTRDTRGQYTPIYASASFPIALDRLADQLSAEMIVEYIGPAGTLAAPADVQIGITVPGARVRGLGVAR
jgi:hypothetical protein